MSIATQNNDTHIYLNLDGIQGECARNDQSGNLMLTGCSQSFARGFGGSTSKCQHSPISCSMEVDKGTPLLLDRIWRATKIAKAEIVCLTDQDQRGKYWRALLEEVYIENMSWSSTPQTTYVNFSLSYQKIEIDYYGPDKSPVPAKYDAVAAQAA